MLLVNVHAMTCHYEALPVNSTDCPLDFADRYPDEEGGVKDYDGMNSDEECPLDPNDGDAESLFNGGTLICEADMKFHMKQYEHEFNDHYWGPDPTTDIPVGNMTETDCEAAVHCEKKLGRTGNYKKCRRINSSREIKFPRVDKILRLTIYQFR